MSHQSWANICSEDGFVLLIVSITHSQPSWIQVLTDNICTTCRSIPKMRSPNGTSPVVELCVNCDDDTPKTQERAPNRDESITSSDATSLNMSRTSTPPTEISSTLSSPTFALPADTEESLRRRRQSDMASTEIGNRLLKGWAMLGDECPRETCFGIPLVRPPKPGGGKDPRKVCSSSSISKVCHEPIDCVLIGVCGLRDYLRS